MGLASVANASFEVKRSQVYFFAQLSSPLATNTITSVAFPPC